MISALAFVPPNDVQNSFGQLAALIRNQCGNAADRVFDYFQDNYVGRFRANASRGTQRVPSHVSACHLVFWKFLEVLQKEESVVRVRILQNEGGHRPLPQRRRYVDCNQCILRIVDHFPNRQRTDYLRGIAHNLAY